MDNFDNRFDLEKSPPLPPRSLWNENAKQVLSSDFSQTVMADALIADELAPMEYPRAQQLTEAESPAQAAPSVEASPEPEYIPESSSEPDFFCAPELIPESKAELACESEPAEAEPVCQSEPICDDGESVSQAENRLNTEASDFDKKRDVKKIIGFYLALAIITAAAVAFFLHYAVIGGELVPLDTARLDLRDSEIGIVSEICRCRELKSLDLRGNDISISQYKRLCRALPECDILCEIPVGDRRYINTTDYLDLSDNSDYTLRDIKRALPCFKKLTAVDVTGGGFDNDKLLDFESDNNVDMIWDIDICGCVVSTGATYLELSDAQGMEYDVLSDNVKYFSSLEAVDLTGCGFDDDTLLSFSESLYANEGVRIVWDVEIGGKTYSTGIKSLIIEGSPKDKKNGVGISDISALKYFTSLIELRMGYNLITDISALSQLSQLRALSLPNNEIKNISAVAQMKNLQFLDLCGNEIADPAPISKLTELTELYLADNDITDVSPILSLEKLEKLSLDNNMLENVGELSALSRLEYLSLYTNHCSDREFEYDEEEIEALIAALPDCDIYYSMDYSI